MLGRLYAGRCEHWTLVPRIWGSGKEVPRHFGHGYDPSIWAEGLHEEPVIFPGPSTMHEVWSQPGLQSGVRGPELPAQSLLELGQATLYHYF